jgi:hypothetical protein
MSAWSRWVAILAVLEAETLAVLDYSRCIGGRVGSGNGCRGLADGFVVAVQQQQHLSRSRPPRAVVQAFWRRLWRALDHRRFLSQLLG